MYIAGVKQFFFYHNINTLGTKIRDGENQPYLSVMSLVFG